jgi:hypothetical protein
MLSKNLQKYDNSFKISFSILFFNTFINKFKHKSDFKQKISILPDINLNILKYFCSINCWCFSTLSKNKNFHIDWVREFPSKNWDFEFLSTHPDYNIIKKYNQINERQFSIDELIREMEIAGQYDSWTEDSDSELDLSDIE